MEVISSGFEYFHLQGFVFSSQIEGSYVCKSGNETMKVKAVITNKDKKSIIAIILLLIIMSNFMTQHP